MRVSRWLCSWFGFARASAPEGTAALASDGDILFGEYRVERFLGRGAFGDVYLVRTPDGTPLALKLIEDAQALDLSEAELLRSFRHPNIVMLYDHRVEGKRIAFVMEYLRGGTLAELVEREGALPQEKALGLFAGICAGVKKAHEQGENGVIHRDLKPQNVLLDAHEVPKITDFGVAKALSRSMHARSATGTPHFMAPEVTQAQPYGKPADVYSLGCLLYYLLTGEPVFPGENIVQVALKHARDKPAIPADWPEPIRELVADCLEKDPGRRPADAGALLARLLAVMEETLQPALGASNDPETAHGVEPGEGDNDSFPVEVPESDPEGTHGVGAVDGWEPPAPEGTGEEATDNLGEQPSVSRKKRRRWPAIVAVLAFLIVAGIAGVYLVQSGTIDLALERPSSEPATSELTSTSQPVSKPAPTPKPTVPAGMVLIPGGSFQMGCVPGDSDCAAREKPRHRVTLDSFFMDVYEVTQGEYQRVIGTNPAKFNDCGPNCPVEMVSWNDAKSYCEKVGKRLPTEAEWEYAARGGLEGKKYPWGDARATCDYAVMDHGGDGCGKDRTWQVGSKPKGKNGYGLYDMAGNVWEWCEDWYGENYYASSSQNNPTGPLSGSARVLRGGSWLNYAWYLRASYRTGGTPTGSNGGIGFRCVRDVE